MFSFFKKKSPAPIQAPLDQTVEADLTLSQASEPERIVSTADSPTAPTAPAPLAAQTNADDPEIAMLPVTQESEEPEASTAEITEVEEIADPSPVKTSWLSRLKGGLAKTGQSISTLFVGVKVDESLFEELETALIMADTGVEATEQLLKTLRARVKKDRIDDAQGVKQALREVLTEHLKVL
ncbi:MAG: signal recognition particle receptor subunit alpha, partial [Sheuella sp.]|nr:signal recognition particle receptor subunit alpha [Sheuella sp.]